VLFSFDHDCIINDYKSWLLIIIPNTQSVIVLHISPFILKVWSQTAFQRLELGHGSCIVFVNLTSSASKSYTNLPVVKSINTLIKYLIFVNQINKTFSLYFIILFSSIILISASAQVYLSSKMSIYLCSGNSVFIYEAFSVISNSLNCFIIKIFSFF